MDPWCLYIQISSSYKDTGQIGLISCFVPVGLDWDPNNHILTCLFKGPIFKNSHILSYWELGLQHINFGGQNSAHNTFMIFVDYKSNIIFF